MSALALDTAMRAENPATIRPARATATRRWAGWITCGGVAVALVTMPLSVAAQLAFGLTLLAAIAVLRPMGQGRLQRLGIMAAGGLTVARYVYWRLTNTLPDPSDPVSFALGLVLVGAELYCAAIMAISLLVNLEPLRRVAPAVLRDEDLPTVDVFIPTYNEDETILAMTVSAARAMDYPAEKLTVWLLDDGGTDQKCADPNPAKAEAARARRLSLQALCTDLGAVYATRARNEHAKAGNLNGGLQKSSGEIVVVFDADHAPFRPFLRETVGCFAEDPRLFLVQTPHVFLNPDPIEKNLQTFDRMPSENEMFYSETQRGLDKWNGSFFCGSAALMRRAALAEAGGFSGVTITEDCETAFELHSKGWTSAFIDKPLIAGLQPETFADFVGQRSRWCQGMIQILVLKNPALKPGLQPIQRLAYLSSMLFWFFPMPRLVFMMAPLLHIFLDLKIFVATVDETIAYTLTYVVANLLLQNALYGRLRWPWMSELYEFVLGVFLWKAIVSVLLSPRKPTFNVTDKGKSLENDHLSPLAWPFVGIFAALAIGVATAFYRYLYDPGVTDLMLVVGIWASFNLVIAGVALGAVAERRQPDRHPRLAIDRRVALRFGGRSHQARAVNVSASGCALRLDGIVPAEHPKPGTRLTLSLQDGSSADIVLQVVRVEAVTADLCEIAAIFVTTGARDYRPIAALMYGDGDAMARFLSGRRNRKGILSGTAQFLRWSVTGPLQAARFGMRKGHAAPAILTAAVPVADMPAMVLVDELVLERAGDPVDVVIEPIAASPEPLAAPLEVLLPESILATEAIEAAEPAEPVSSRLSGPTASEWLWMLVAMAQEEIRLAAMVAPASRPAQDAVEADRTMVAALLGLTPSDIQQSAPTLDLIPLKAA